MNYSLMGEFPGPLVSIANGKDCEWDNIVSIASANDCEWENIVSIANVNDCKWFEPLNYHL